jgi:hypothetical protein
VKEFLAPLQHPENSKFCLDGLKLKIFKAKSNLNGKKLVSFGKFQNDVKNRS